MKQTTKIALAVAAGAAALLLKKKHSVDGVGKVLENDFYGAAITTTDGRKAVRFWVNGNTIMVFALQKDYKGYWDYWYTIGKGYSTLAGAKRAAVREMRKMGYELDQNDLNNL